MSDSDPHGVQRHLGPKKKTRRKKTPAQPRVPFKRATLNKGELFKMLNYEPHPGQQVVHDVGPTEYGGYRHRVLACGCRFGKSHLGAHELLALALAPNEHKFEAWCLAPYHNLADITFSMVCSVVTQYLPEHVIRHSAHEGVLELRNLRGVPAVIRRRSAERGLVSLSGTALDFALIDESSAVGEDVWASAVRPRLVDRLGATLLCSTPRGTSGFFARMLRAGLRGDDPSIWAITAPSWTNPRLDPAEILEAKSRMEGWRFRQEFCGELVARSGKVFDLEAIEACSVGELQDPRPGKCYVAGLDLAATHDYTVLVVCRRAEGGLAETVHISRWRKMPFADQIQKAGNILDRYNAPCRVDQTGLGLPVVQQMREAGLSVQGVTFSQQKKNALIRNLAVLLERKRIILPKRHLCPEMHDELSEFIYLDGEGSDLRRMGAPSGGTDDVVCAAALCASYFRAGGGANRFHHRTVSRVATPTPHEASHREHTGVFDQPEPIHYGGFYNPKTGQRLSQPTPRAHTPRRRGGGLGRSLFRDR